MGPRRVLPAAAGVLGPGSAPTQWPWWCAEAAASWSCDGGRSEGAGSSAGAPASPVAVLGVLVRNALQPPPPGSRSPGLCHLGLGEAHPVVLPHCPWALSLLLPGSSRAPSCLQRAAHHSCTPGIICTSAASFVSGAGGIPGGALAAAATASFLGKRPSCLRCRGGGRTCRPPAQEQRCGDRAPE